MIYHNERDVKRAVKKLLDEHNYFWWMPAANGYGKSGIADIHAIKNGIFCVIETKFGGNKPTKLQEGFLQSIHAETGYAFVVDENRVEWLEAWLSAFDRAVGHSLKKEDIPPEDGALMLNALRELTKEIL